MCRAGERWLVVSPRGAAAALLAAALLLLLLLARLPPPAPPRRPPPAAAAPPPPSPPPPASAATPAPGSVAARYEAGHSVAHAERCPRLGAAVRVLVLVASAPGNVSARQAVRLTWGAAAARSDLALAFVLGRPPPSLRPAIAAEDALYNDLVLGNSIDSYANLTLKTLSMLEWADTYCPRADFLLKTDDDMFINIPLLVRFASARLNQSRSIWGRVMAKERPSRARRAKYFVPVSEWPGLVFPAFATGPAYLVSGDSVGALRAAAGPARFLRLEDVFVTGVLAQRLHVRRRHAAEFLNRRALPDACALRRRLALHQVRAHEQFELWRRLHDPAPKCKR